MQSTSFMLLLPHTAMGLLIGTFFPNPLISWPLSFLSHFGLDLVPHWDFFTKSSIKKFSWKSGWIRVGIVMDFVLALGVGLFFVVRAGGMSSKGISLLGSAFFANLPDGLEMPLSLGITSPFIEKWYLFQKGLQNRSLFPWGLLPQLAVLGVSLWLLLSLR